MILPVLIGGLAERKRQVLEVWRAEGAVPADVAIVHGREDFFSTARGLRRVEIPAAPQAERRLKREPRIRVSVELPAGATTTIGLKLALGDDAHPGASSLIHLIHRDGSRIAGGVAVELRAPGASR